jgi:hypothetical protein
MPHCDNARVHVNAAVKDAVECRGALPTRTPALFFAHASHVVLFRRPDFNPVELFFNTVKHFIRRNGQAMFDQGLDDVTILKSACASITSVNVNSFIRFVASRA